MTKGSKRILVLVATTNIEEALVIKK